MDIVKTASDWARFEMLSTFAFMTFGLAVDLSRFRAAPSAHLGHLVLEGQGAFPSQC